MNKVLLVSMILSLSACASVGTILQSGGQGLMHAHDNTYSCVDYGNGHFSCNYRGYVYNCVNFGNEVSCH